jgi:hypothetical protein
MQRTPDIAVIHLVRACNDNKAVAQFVDSYLEQPAGYDHKLIFLLKGFARELPGDLAAVLDRVPHARILCPEGGYDIGSYYHAVASISEPLVMFLNSFSVIQGEHWLLKMVRAYRGPGVGLVGASGSWESLVSTLLAAPNSSAVRPVGRWFSRLSARLIGLPLQVLFPEFPNPHVRSNAFLLAREEFIAIRPARIRIKLQAWLFESGRASMTRRILDRGLRVMVVGRDGTAYSITEWPLSRIFWQDQQENLLIHDNRSMAYSQAGAARQAQLCRAAWNCRCD